MLWNIVADSSCDLRAMDDMPDFCGYASVPLKISFKSGEFTDDENIDISELVDAMRKNSAKSATACPSPDKWISEFEKADNTIAFTISGGVSGTINSAMLAREDVLNKHPDKNIYVMDTLSTGPEMILLARKALSLIKEGASFSDVVVAIKRYAQHTGLLFMLERMDNLINNGRVGKLQGKLAGILGIRIVGRASELGTLDLLHKCRGRINAYDTMIKELIRRGYAGGRAAICHCLNPEGAKWVKETILTMFKNAEVSIYPTGGLCSYYAEEGGLLIGFEN